MNDQVGAPTWSRSIASMTGDIVGFELTRGAEFGDGLAGLFHLSAAGQTTWYDFARSILENDPRREEQRCRRVVPISSEEFAAEAKRPIAKRPAYSVLDNTLFQDRFRLSLVDWREPLDSVLAEL